MADRDTGCAVVTGLGVVCPIGIGHPAYWDSVMAGRSGVTPYPLLQGTPMPVQFGGHIAGFEPKQYVKPRKSLKVMCREIQLGFAAAQLSVEDAGLRDGELDPDRFGVVLGSDMLYGEVPELEDVFRSCLTPEGFDFGRWGAAMSNLNPLWMLKYLPNMAACHIGIAHDARGHNNSITLGDVSSLLAMIEAARVIERGHADVMLCGGTGSRLSLTAMMYRGDSNLSHRSQDPAAASRPFDQSRDGIVNGEGAAVLVVERRAHAEARGAKIMAEIAGCGAGFEPRNANAETGEAMRAAIKLALQDAQVEPAEIGHVNARGESTIEGDIAEATAIRDFLGDVPVTALKSYFGHLGAGTGAVEAVGSVLALAEGVVPPTMNCSHVDPACPIRVVQNPTEVDRPVAMLLNQAGTGQAAAVILRRPR